MTIRISRTSLGFMWRTVAGGVVVALLVPVAALGGAKNWKRERRSGVEEYGSPEPRPTTTEAPPERLIDQPDMPPGQPPRPLTEGAVIIDPATGKQIKLPHGLSTGGPKISAPALHGPEIEHRPKDEKSPKDKERQKREFELKTLAESIGHAEQGIHGTDAIRAFFEAAGVAHDRAETIAAGFSTKHAAIPVTFERPTTLLRFASDKDHLIGIWFWPPGANADVTTLAMNSKYPPAVLGQLVIPTGMSALIGTAGPLNDLPGGATQITLVDTTGVTIKSILDLAEATGGAWSQKPEWIAASYPAGSKKQRPKTTFAVRFCDSDLRPGRKVWLVFVPALMVH